MKKALYLSLIVHVIFLSLKINEPKPTKPKKKSPKITKIKIKQEKKKSKKGESKDNDIYVLNEIMEKLQKALEDQMAVQKIMSECDKFYMGIGVTHSSLFGEITNVAPGGPADRAGIRKGDIPLDELDIRDKYPEGTTITVSVLRNGIIHNIPVTIGKICIREKSSP